MRYLQTLAEHGWSPVRLQAVQAAATRWQHHLRRSVQRGLSAAAADRFAMSVLEPRLLMAAAPTAPTFATPTTLRAPTHAEVLAQEQSQQVAVQHIRTAISSAATLKTQLGQESEQFQNVLQQQQSDVPSPESLVTTLSTPRGGALSFTGGPRFESSRETFTGANFLLEVNPDYAGDVQVTVDGESHYVPLTGSLLLEGSQDSDALTLDFSNGDPMPSGGVSFDSGSGQIPLTIQPCQRDQPQPDEPSEQRRT